MSNKFRNENQIQSKIPLQDIKTPQLSKNIYSFKDPMFESFGNGYKQSINTKSSDMKFKQMITKRENEFQQLAQISQKISLLNQMLKISKNIIHPSVISLNGKNKTKTQMIIEMNKQSESQNSKVLCQNAGKYLKILEVINEQYSSFDYQYQCLKRQGNSILRHVKQMKKELESKIQNQSQIKKVSNQTTSIKKLNYLDKQSQIQDNRQKVEQIKQNTKQKRQKTKQKRQNKSFNESFINTASQRYCSEYVNDSNSLFKNQQSNDQMFQKISTPKISQKYLVPQKYFSPFQQNVYFRLNKDDKSTQKQRRFNKLEKIGNKRRQNISQDNIVFQQLNLKLPNSKVLNILKGQKSNQKSFNRKIQKIQKKSQKFAIAKLDNGKKKDIKSQRQSVNSFQSKSKQNKMLSTNLAMETVNQTNQFQKMLKMTSSRIKD